MIYIRSDAEHRNEEKGLDGGAIIDSAFYPIAHMREVGSRR